MSPIDQADEFQSTVNLHLHVGTTGFNQCTGTLISCRHVLTAQHCFNDEVTQIDVIFTSYRALSRGGTRTTLSLDPVAGQNVLLLNPDLEGDGIPSSRDLMIIELPVAVRGYKPVPLCPHWADSSQPLNMSHFDTEFPIAGYGVAVQGDPCGFDDERHYGSLSVWWDEALTYQDGGWTIQARPRGSTLGAGLGDSGGPLFARARLDVPEADVRAGDLFLLGAFTWTVSDPNSPICDHGTTFAYVPGQLSWIRSVLGEPEPDTDGDGYPDACDACAGHDDDVQCGTSGIPLGCYPCDCDEDADFDTICDDQDTCPWAPNNQAGNINSNFIAEQILTPGDHRGDACDPAPVPALRRGMAQVERDSLYTYTTCDRFELTPIRSNGTLDTQLRYLDATGVPTHFRYCQNPVVLGDPDCLTRDALDPVYLSQVPSAEQELREQPYHRITVELNGERLERGAAPELDYINEHGNDTRAVHQLRWVYMDDVRFWNAHPGLITPVDTASTLPPPQSYTTRSLLESIALGEPTDLLRGVLAARGSAYVDPEWAVPGYLGEDLDIGTGTHGAGVGSAHVLISGMRFRRFESSYIYRQIAFCLPGMPPGFPAACPVPDAPYFVVRPIGDYFASPIGGGGPCGPLGVACGVPRIVAIDRFARTPVVLDFDGRAYEAPQLVPQTIVDATLAADTRWVLANDLVSRPGQVAGLLLSSDARQLIGGVGLSADGFLGAIERGSECAT